MKKESIVVPEGYRYIGEWEGYRLEDYNFPHILNKKLTGCGFTEYCIKNKQNLILTSPRKFLLENKEEQHEGEVYYVRNEIETSVDFETTPFDDRKAINERKATSKMSKEEVIANLENLKRGIMEAYEKRDPDKPFKILVTYDSFRHVKDALMHYKHKGTVTEEVEENIFDDFQVVVDEFQSIFIDSRFKSDTEIELLDNLRGVKKVCYVSATPTMEKYLDRLPEFRDLPYYELDWETADPERVRKPILEIRFIHSLSKAVGQVIKSYQKGRFETRIDHDTGKMIESREAVIFMNSVTGICQAIRSNRLHLEDCNILCAYTTENQEAVRKAFNDVYKKENPDKSPKDKDMPWIDKKTRVIGKIPTKGEPHKMFTFCTRTVYLGADFYSTNARSFVFSDSNIECLAVDISIDLEQILGRQRLDENPWKNSALMYVKTTSEHKKYKEEDFNRFVEKKKKSTQDLLNVYKKGEGDELTELAKNYRIVALVNHYRDNYVAVTRVKNPVTGEVVKLQPVFNNLVLVSEERAFEIQQKDYKDRFSVFTSVKGKNFDSISEDVIKLAEEINSLRDVSKKLKCIVEFGEKNPDSKKDVLDLLELLPGKYKDYYLLLGPEKIKGLQYKESKIKTEWRTIISDGEITDTLVSEIYKTFEVGKRYTKADIKEILKGLYKKLGYSKTAKASDLETYFYMKAIKLQEDKKWVHGFEIIGKK